MEKIAGAAAEQQRPLKEVADICREVNANARSMGMALTSCTVPAAGTPTFELGDDEIEMGVGIHGEPGRERMKMKTASEIVELMATRDRRRPAVLKRRQRAGVRQRHGRHAAHRAVRGLQRAEQVPVGGRGISISRNLIGSYITSLEMAGCSITLLKMNDDYTQLWDAPVKTAGLRWGV